jgi:NAD(P)H-dependent flavin oxidoreductase YrpB (nitropropane dioxygenase family)
MAVSLDTPLCSLLGCRFPVLSVGFSAGAGPELVAAVSNAGGFGVLGAGGMPPELIRAEVKRTRGLTGSPFGVNLIIAADPEYPDEDRDWFLSQIAAAADAGAAAVVLFWRDPAPFVEAAHAGGLKVLIQVGSVQEAESAVVAGVVDAVIAQGIEAGGHVRGTTSIWELIPRTIEAVSPTPVLASGGIGDGAGLARALELGAQGVSLGTRFVASDEAYVPPAYKDRASSQAMRPRRSSPPIYSMSTSLMRLTERSVTGSMRNGRPRDGHPPANGRVKGQRSDATGAGPVRSRTGRATESGWRHPSSTAISSTPLCGLVSHVRSLTTSSRRERSSTTLSDTLAASATPVGEGPS